MIKALRIRNFPDLQTNSYVDQVIDLSSSYAPYPIEMHTGTYDRNGIEIYEGDLLRSKTCETPFKVENIVDFLLMCGRYEEKNGAPIFDSLEIVKE
jgi:hypothetical protein